MSVAKEQLPSSGSLPSETRLMITELRLKEDVELIQGANNHMMLYNARRGNYIRLSPLGATVVEMLDGTLSGNDVVKQLEERYPGRSNVGELVVRFFNDLWRSGVLNVNFEPEVVSQPLLYRLAQRPMLRMSMGKSVDRLSGFFALILEATPSAARQVVGLLILTAALGTTVYAGWKIGFRPDMFSAVWWAVLPIMLLHLVGHEMAHAVLCRYYKVPIREAGIGLLYYFLPVAYVDRTDAYRLRKKRGRIFISLAGPAYDLVGAGFWAAVALYSGQGFWSDTAHLLFIMELMLMVNNLNLLLPTDGYHAVEAAVGELALRQRALHYLYYKISRKPLPAAYQHLGTFRKWSYTVYTILSVGYFLGLLSGFFYLGYSQLNM